MANCTGVASCTGAVPEGGRGHLLNEMSTGSCAIRWRCSSRSSTAKTMLHTMAMKPTLESSSAWRWWRLGLGSGMELGSGVGSELGFGFGLVPGGGRGPRPGRR